MRGYMLILLAFVAAAPVGAPALAEPATPTAQPGLDMNQRVCRTFRTVGSRLARTRQCATRAEWVEYDAAQRRQTQETLRQGTQPQCMTSRQAQPGGIPASSCQ
jgi:hypothetical protein